MTRERFEIFFGINEIVRASNEYYNRDKKKKTRRMRREFVRTEFITLFRLLIINVGKDK